MRFIDADALPITPIEVKGNDRGSKNIYNRHNKPP